jgi:hypothetical protein
MARTAFSVSMRKRARFSKVDAGHGDVAFDELHDARPSGGGSALCVRTVVLSREKFGVQSSRLARLTYAA